MRHPLLFFVIFCFFFSTANNFSQEATPRPTPKTQRQTEIVKSSEGREFYLCFMVNFNEDQGSNSKPLEIMIFITSEFDAKVQIDFPKEKIKETVNVKAGQIISYPLNRFAQSTLFEIEDVGQAIHITSDVPISVYGLNRRQQTTDNYLAFPIEVLGTEYMVLSYYSFDSKN